MNKIFTLIFSVLILFSCSKSSPAGFWNKFNSESIIEKSSDQGPYGGKRKIVWKNFNNKLLNQDFLKFANKNGWELIDSLEIRNNDFNSDKTTNLDKYSIEIIKNEIIPKILNQNSKIFIFKTGWIRIKPGNEIETQQNGFLVFDSVNKTYNIFHNWGE